MIRGIEDWRTKESFDPLDTEVIVRNPKMFMSRVRFFEGYRGVKQSYRTMLKECQGKEMTGFFSVVEDVGRELQDFFAEDYVPSRVRRGIHVRNIALESPRSIAYQSVDKAELRETKLISKRFFPTINMELTLYDDCLHFMSFNDQSAFALIIQDPSVVADLKSIFEAVWRQRMFLG